MTVKPHRGLKIRLIQPVKKRNWVNDVLRQIMYVHLLPALENEGIVEVGRYQGGNAVDCELRKLHVPPD